MIKDITLGQYFPGKSIVHRLDPRMKIILTILYIVTIFLTKNVYCYLAVFLSSILLVLVSRISLKVVRTLMEFSRNGCSDKQIRCIL